MLCTLPCRISMLRDDETTAVTLAVRAEDASRFLCCLDGLKMGRIGKLLLQDQKSSVAFIFQNDFRMTVSAPGCSFGVVLGTGDEELLRCCCVDGYLGSYSEVHTDLEFGDFDFSFAVS